VNRAAVADPLGQLERQHPEWRAWLRLLEAARVEMRDPRYDAAVPERPVAPSGAPLVEGAVLELSRRAADRWVRGLLTRATDAGASSTLADAARTSALDPFAILESAIAVDRARLDTIADANGADRDAFAAVASIAAMPLLQACGRRWSSHVAATWDHGYCPICGAWPALAEARGLERERRLRCTRCGGDWRTEWLRCPFCGTRDHLELGALAPEATVETRKAETCAACRRYVKTVTTLKPTPPDEVAIQDLATVDLDLAALGHGYQGAQGLGGPVNVHVTSPARWLRLAWNR
jgi:FdhE protein